VQELERLVAQVELICQSRKLRFRRLRSLSLPALQRFRQFGMMRQPD
jgi:hypothetical protein